MIHVDISNIWGEFSLPDLLACEQQVDEAHRSLDSGQCPGARMRGWMELPTAMQTPELEGIMAAAKTIRENSDALVVVDAGGASLAARAVIELLKGQNHNLSEEDPQIFFAGSSLSTAAWNDLCRQLSGKDFSINIISFSDDEAEAAITARALRRLLEHKYGPEKAGERVFLTTGKERGTLRRLADTDCTCFFVPEDVAEHFGALTAAGLLPMAVAGVHLPELLGGAAEAKEEMDNMRAFDNPVWLYAAARTMLAGKGKTMELLAGYEPDFRGFGRWWQQLFATAEGKNGLGLFPVPVEFPADLYSLGQMIGQGRRNLFQTVVRFQPSGFKTSIELDWRNPDGLNYLEGRTLDDVQEQAVQAALDAHGDSGVPVITVDAGELCAATLGELIYFFQLSCALSAGLLGVDPYDRSGLSAYCRNRDALLGKPD